VQIYLTVGRNEINTPNSTGLFASSSRDSLNKQRLRCWHMFVLYTSSSGDVNTSLPQTCQFLVHTLTAKKSK